MIVSFRFAYLALFSAVDLVGAMSSDSEHGFTASAAPAQLEICDLCDDTIDHEDLSLWFEFGMKKLHNTCYGGLRCLKRMSNEPSKKVKMKASIDECRVTNLEKFKGIGMSLVTDTPKSRTAFQRTEVVNFVELMVSENSVAKKKKVMLLNKLQHIAWHMRLGMPREEAKKKWKADKDDSDIYKEEEDGKLVIAVRKPTTITHEDKLSKQRQATVRSAALDPTEARGKVLKANKGPSDSMFTALGGEAFKTGAASTMQKVIVFLFICDILQVMFGAFALL